jgi:hypothetical protein
MPHCRWPDLRPASSGRTCAQTPPSSNSPAPLRPPPPCHRSLCSRRRHLPSSRHHHLPSSRRHRSLACAATAAPARAVATPSRVALLPPPLTLRHRRLLSRHTVASACAVVVSSRAAPSPLLALLKKLRRPDASIRWSALPPKRRFTDALKTMPLTQNSS